MATGSFRTPKRHKRIPPLAACSHFLQPTQAGKIAYLAKSAILVELSTAYWSNGHSGLGAFLKFRRSGFGVVVPGVSTSMIMPAMGS